jgi:hypothetical protein
MENPFESGHIKNYILAYSSVVVIMVLFFIASTLFNDIKDVEKKEFNTNVSKATNKIKIMKNIIEVNRSKFKLMPKAY